MTVKALLLLGAAALLAGCLGSGGPVSKPDLPAAKEAASASACVKVDATICPCDNGGTVTAIHRDHVDQWRQWLEQQRANSSVICGSTYNCEDQAPITVRNGTCTIEANSTRVQVPLQPPEDTG